MGDYSGDSGYSSDSSDPGNWVNDPALQYLQNGGWYTDPEVYTGNFINALGQKFDDLPPNEREVWKSQYGGNLLAAANAWIEQSNAAPQAQQTPYLNMGGQPYGPLPQTGQMYGNPNPQYPQQAPTISPGGNVAGATPPVINLPPKSNPLSNAAASAMPLSTPSGTPVAPLPTPAGATTVVSATGAQGTPTPINSSTGIGGTGGTHTMFGDVQNGALPGNMGLDWWQLFGQMMKSLTDATGTVYNPITGQPMTAGDGSLQKTLASVKQAADIRQKDTEIQQSQQRIDDLRRSGDMDRAQREEEYKRTLSLQRDTLQQNQNQFDADLGFKVGSALGVLNGQQTLEAQKFQADETARAYTRAANPATSFENELARANGQGYQQPTTAPIAASANLTPQATPAVPAYNQTPAGAAPDMVYATSAPQAQVQGALPAFTSLVPTPQQLTQQQINVPAAVNAVRSGGLVPTAGAFGQNTMAPAAQAALTTTDFRKANQRTMAGLNPLQKQIVGSYGRAGGVGDEMQDYYANAGKPRGGSVSTSYAT